MKFFTLEWWCGLQELEISNPAPEYRKHLAAIRDRLPSDLLALQESVSLHDARLRKFLLDARERELTLQLDGGDGRGGLRQFLLTYCGVSSLRSVADPDVGLQGPHGYGDFGYDEVDLLDQGEFEHRMLFSTGIELEIRFAGFQLAWADL